MSIPIVRIMRVTRAARKMLAHCSALSTRHQAEKPRAGIAHIVAEAALAEPPNQHLRLAVAAAPALQRLTHRARHSIGAHAANLPHQGREAGGSVSHRLQYAHATGEQRFVQEGRACAPAFLRPQDGQSGFIYTSASILRALSASNCAASISLYCAV